MILLQSHLFIILSCLFTISQQEPIQCINIKDCIESFREFGISVLTFLFSIWGYTRVRPRFFDQVGHQTTNASIENKHFFTK